MVEDDDGGLSLYKSQTTPDDPVRGLLDVVEVAARERGISREAMLGQGEMFIHGTTRATNAILTNSTAKTAFLTTQGHPDILVFREGGRSEPFNFTRPYPEPYVPRSLTFEVPERIGSAGEVVLPLDEGAVLEVIEKLARAKVQAVGVCLLWSIANPAHELKVAELLDAHLPGIPYTLSHVLNPTLREYRRASAACIDASLKPVMTDYLRSLSQRLRQAGFKGRVLGVTSNGGVLDADDLAVAPIHTIKSGPAMAPVAGRYYAGLDSSSENAIIADTGGTSYDVSLVRRGRIPWTRETWLGPQFFGHMTGFPSVDVKSIGAGGGSIAWVDDGGLVHVGPESAGAVPGPACYGRGGTRPTVTDASLVLGYIDPQYFLGGAMLLDPELAAKAVSEHVGKKLGLDVHRSAAAILELTTEHMVRAIEEITLYQGIDPRSSVLVGGGGAAGLNAAAIARRLGCAELIIPEVGAVLSAAGALMSDLTADYAGTQLTASSSFNFDGVNQILRHLKQQGEAFISGPGAGSRKSEIEFSVEARYPHQIWELEVPLRTHEFSGPEDVERLRQDFHDLHKEVFAISDPESPVEMVGWRARVRCQLRATEPGKVTSSAARALTTTSRSAYFSETGLAVEMVEVKVLQFEAMQPGVIQEGPAIIESPVTTVVIEPGAAAERKSSGTLSIRPAIDAPLGVARLEESTV